MKVAELKASIRMHNQAYAIRGYSHMNKGSLVDALAKQDRNSFCTLSIMVNAHNKSRDELKVMKVAELKTLVRKHNLDNAIRRYSKMKKSELVDALMKHSTSDKPAAKPAPKPAAKKPAAKKPKLEVVKEKKKAAPKKEDDDLYDDFFDNVGKGKVTGAKSKAAIAFSAKVAKDKAERRALERNDPAAYEAKMNAIHAAQQLPSQSELFDMKKKAARQKKPAAKKPVAKKAAPKKKPAAKKEFVYMIPGLAELGRSKGRPLQYIEQQRKAEAFAKEFLKRQAAFLAGTGPVTPFGWEAKFSRDKDFTRAHALSIKFLLVTKPALEAFAKTPEGLAKAALDRKNIARDSTVRREGVERRAKERKAATAARKAAKDAAKKAAKDAKKAAKDAKKGGNK